jgi:NAD(P)-dependent dehydrogenase (short-subunit alcohol dehydrogenase family)
MAVIYDDLKNRHVLITGGAGGIGAGVSTAFARQGSRVTILDRDADAGNALAERLRDQGGSVDFREIDLTDFDRLSGLLKVVRDHSGPVHVLINNAGWDPRYSLVEMTVEQWDALFKLNVGHYFVTCRELIPSMIQAGGGSIIMTASHQFWIGFGNLTCYNTTKGAIVGMVRSLAREVGRHLIRVNAIAPGWVMTERQLRDMVTPEIKKKLFEEQQILPLYLTPDNLAGSYLFLASDQSRPITRQTLVVDAGFAMS